MPVCLSVRILNTQDGTTIERTFDRSPVRIGRSPINELPIDAAFVSQFHAVLEFDGQRVTLWDLGSLNGTALRATGRMQPNAPVDLTPHNFEFAIVSMLFQVGFVNAAPQKPQVKREGLLLSLDAAAMQEMLQNEGAAPGPAGAASHDRTRELMQRLQPAYKTYREAWDKLHSELVATLEPLDPTARHSLLAQVRADMSAVLRESDFEPISSKFGKKPTGGRELVQTMTGGDFAMQALCDLAASYLPNKGPLKDRLELIIFAQKLQDLLAVFFKCFIALRDGHRQFKMQMDIRQTRQPNEQMTAARAIQTARDPRELGARLLDWSNPSTEGARAIESSFAEVMVHHVALLSVVTRGVRSLLAKLAPAAIEAELENPRRKSAGGSRLGPFRYKTLWQLFMEIYGDFAEDEKQAFALIFGPEFADAYGELASEAAPEGPPSAFAPER